jgi:phenylpropionate dioxygenase-like ring-hydroxylating dioxygenase large terminal subunit
LFGENFVAFRATDGRVGLFDEGCPHRGASLLLARNEDCSLTCIFHGWKFHVSGKAVEVPTEPPETHDSFCGKVPLKAYPVHEAGGIIWVWLGEGNKPPQFPLFDLNKVPASHVTSRIGITNCNWVQALEGGIDSAHVGVLHQHWIKKSNPLPGVRDNLAPRYEIEPRPYGFSAAAIRKLPDGTQLVRITEYVQPFYSFIPRNVGDHEGAFLLIFVPIDDEHTAQWLVQYNRTRPRTQEDIDQFEEMFGVGGPNPDNFYNPPGTFDNRWHQDREILHQHFTGVSAFVVEDFIVQESAGAIVDRTKEYLGATDALIIKVRLEFLKSLEEFQLGKAPLGLDQEITYDQIRAQSIKIPIDADWRKERMTQ